MRLDGIDAVYDNSEDFTVVSVYRLNDLFQIGVCCGIMLDDQHNAVGLLDKRKRVDYYADGRSIEDDIIKVLFKLLDKLSHTLTGEKL